LLFREVHRAISQLVPLDTRQSDAVDARIELDFRIGTAFTRLQTLFLQSNFPDHLSKQVISYGIC